METYQRPTYAKKDGTLATTPEENAEVFVKHFDKLYNRHPEFDDTVLDLLDQHPIAADCDHPPTDEEIQKEISALKNAPGDSGICPPIWKAIMIVRGGIPLSRLILDREKSVNT